MIFLSIFFLNYTLLFFVLDEFYFVSHSKFLTTLIREFMFFISYSTSFTIVLIFSPQFVSIGKLNI